MLRVQSFPPIADVNAEVLILGSMPGKASLTAVEYYAHPRNVFWPIMGELFDAKTTLPYEKRIAILQSTRIALWDVLESCIRDSSLDNDIQNASLTADETESLSAPLQFLVQTFPEVLLS